MSEQERKVKRPKEPPKGDDAQPKASVTEKGKKLKERMDAVPRLDARWQGASVTPSLGSTPSSPGRQYQCTGTLASRSERRTPGRHRASLEHVSFESIHSPVRSRASGNPGATCSDYWVRCLGPRFRGDERIIRLAPFGVESVERLTAH